MNAPAFSQSVISTGNFCLLPLSQLSRSEKNTRTIHPKNDPADIELLASIREHGILQNIICYSDGEGGYLVPAGGRRLGALEALHSDGAIKSDHLVPCYVIEESNATNISLIENYLRKETHLADSFTAFNTLVKEGRTVKQIALEYGMSELAVNRCLRLGALHKTLFNAFKKDELSLEQVMMFASTPDTKAQLAVFKLLGEDKSVSPSRIKQALLESRLDENAALAKFVTVDAYKGAGGAIEHDLFAETKTLIDIELLTRLAEDKLDNAAAELREWKWAKTDLTGNPSIHQYGQLPKELKGVPEAKKQQLKNLNDQLEVLENIECDDWYEQYGEASDDIENAIYSLEQSIEHTYSSFNSDDTQYAGCVVTFDSDGELLIIKGLLENDDLVAYRHKESVSSTDEKPAPAPAKKGLTQAHAADLGQIRHSACVASLLKSPKMSVDLFQFNLCLATLGSGMEKHERFFNVSCNYTENTTENVELTPAGIEIDKALAALDTSWLSKKSTTQKFAAFRALSASKRHALMGYCTAIYFTQGHGKDKFIDPLMVEIEHTVSNYFTPTFDNYFNRLNKQALLDLGVKWYGKKWLQTHGNDKKKNMADSFHKLFNDPVDNLSEKELAIRHNWLPNELK